MRNILISLLFTLQTCAPAFAQESIGKFDLMESHDAPKNFVKNPGAEKTKASDTVTDASTIATRSVTTPIEGKASFAIDATTSGQTVKFLTNNFSAAGTYLKNQQCRYEFLYSGDATLYKTYVEENVSTKVSADLQLKNAGTDVYPATIIYPCGDLSANRRIVIESTGNGAAIKVDKLFVGSASISAIPEPIPPTVTKLTSGTSYTVPAGVKQIHIRMVGGGGGGGGGGHSASVGVNGTAGGSTTFSSFLTATGGGGGQGNVGGMANAAAPGSCTVLSAPAFGTQSVGNYGDSAGTTPTAYNYSAGASGGASPFGGAGANVVGASGNSGSGGGGGYAIPTTSVQSGAGAGGSSGGFCDAYVNNPSGSYTYAIGAAGTGGSTPYGLAGPGLNGGSGYIEITEYYSPSANGGGGLTLNTPNGPTTAQYLTGNGTFTTPVGAKRLIVQLRGGGGGGSGGGATSTMGAGGTGGTTTFGSFTATGGGGGQANGGPGSGGGVCTGAGFCENGGHGSSGAFGNGAQSAAAGGSGGGAGGGAGGAAQGPGAGVAGVTNTGGGGGGGGTGNGFSGYAGGGGQAGGRLFTIIENPATTYSYCVGNSGTCTGGAAGTAGTSGAAGGAGAVGQIDIIVEYDNGQMLNIAPTAPRMIKFASSGTYTPTPGTKYIWLRAVGGGGGGGAGGTSGNNGGDGGPTSFGSIVTASGGTAGAFGGGGGGGGAASYTAPADGKCWYGAQGNGGGGSNSPGAMYLTGGVGGASPFGGAGAGAVNGAAGAAIANSGSGGGGGSTTNVTSASTGTGGGAGGYCDVIIPNPTSQTVTIGYAGNQGNTIAFGYNGSAGGTGYILIWEY